MSQEMGVLSVFDSRASDQSESIVSFMLKGLFFLPRMLLFVLVAIGFIIASVSTSALSYIAGVVAAGLPFDKFIWDTNISDWTWRVGFCSLDEFLYRNWLKVDWGSDLELYKTKKRGGRRFPAGPWQIDFLAQDRKNKDLVVIHQKRNVSSDATVGQLLKHISWVKENIAEPGQNVRGIIVTRETDPALDYAVKNLKFIEVRTYSTSVDFSLTLKAARTVSLPNQTRSADGDAAEADSTASDAVVFSFDAAEQTADAEAMALEGDEMQADAGISSKSKR